MSFREPDGYIFQADTYCASCIIDRLPTGPGGAFDGWALADGAPPISAEANLSEIAYAFGIDRDDEASFDSDAFPKVILDADGADACAWCGEIIGGPDLPTFPPEEYDALKWIAARYDAGEYLLGIAACQSDDEGEPVAYVLPPARFHPAEYCAALEADNGRPESPLPACLSPDSELAAIVLDLLDTY